MPDASASSKVSEDPGVSYSCSDQAPPRFLAAVRLAGMLKADGGMPGADKRERIVFSLVALAVFARYGHAPRIYTERLAGFVEKADKSGLSKPQRRLLEQVLETVLAGEPIEEEWEELGKKLATGTLGSAAAWKALKREFARP